MHVVDAAAAVTPGPNTHSGTASVPSTVVATSRRFLKVSVKLLIPRMSSRLTHPKRHKLLYKDDSHKKGVTRVSR
ncbi:hypothetical protein GCM10027610_090240 [Dactylosporangium cerinum]